MTHHRELLILANRLLRRPNQAALRRSVSTAYYALFHLLVDACVKKATGTKSRHLRAPLSRNFDHKRMRAAAEAFSGVSLPPAERFASRGSLGVAATIANNPARPNLPQLREVALTFKDLQEARHRADYDLSSRFTPTEARDFVERAQRAFAAWRSARKTPEGHEFLMALTFWPEAWHGQGRVPELRQVCEAS